MLYVMAVLVFAHEGRVIEHWKRRRTPACRSRRSRSEQVSSPKLQGHHDILCEYCILLLSYPLLLFRVSCPSANVGDVISMPQSLGCYAYTSQTLTTTGAYLATSSRPRRCLLLGILRASLLRWYHLHYVSDRMLVLCYGVDA